MMPELKLYLIAVGIGALLVGGLWGLHERKVAGAFRAGQTDVLLELAKEADEMREAIAAADEGTGDVEDDLAWIDRELERIGLRLEGSKP